VANISSMNKYSSYSTIADVVDLHDINGRGNPISEQDVWNVLDNFMHTMEHKHSMKLKKGFSIKVGVIVGKGVRSKNWINGKNPLRAYTEEYLNHCNLNWRNGRYGEGEEGVIVVELS
jgi:hypothetical protein